MWFVLGVLCGVVGCGAVFFFLPKEKHAPLQQKVEPISKGSRKEWVQTRNFLYYDGTMMPEIKEDSNE